MEILEPNSLEEIKPANTEVDQFRGEIRTVKPLSWFLWAFFILWLIVNGTALYLNAVTDYLNHLR